MMKDRRPTGRPQPADRPRSATWRRAPAFRRRPCRTRFPASRGVTGDRRRAVLEAVAALGYKSNHMASSLRRGETRTVGIVVPNLGNEFFAGLVRQWEKIASTQRLRDAGGGERRRSGDRGAADRIADRAADRRAARRRRRGRVRRRPRAFPQASRRPCWSTAPSATRISIRSASGNFDAGYRGCRHLLDLGHRDITLLISSTNHTHLQRSRRRLSARARRSRACARASALSSAAERRRAAGAPSSRTFAGADPPTACSRRHSMRRSAR